VAFLTADLAILLQRDALKLDPEGEKGVRSCNDWFATFNVDPRFVLETDSMSVPEVANTILQSDNFLTNISQFKSLHGIT
jgi:hypothetical protein